MVKLGRPKGRTKIRIAITIDRELHETVREFKASKFFNAAGRAFIRSKRFEKFKRGE